MSSRTDMCAASSASRPCILAAAARLFSERGLDATTMADIANEACCSEAALYGLFSSRRRILDALAEQLFDDIPRMFAVDFPSAHSLQPKIELMLCHLLDWLIEHRDLMLLHSHLPTKVDLNRLLVNYLAVWLRRNASDDDDEMNGHDAELLALHLVGVLQASFQRWLGVGQRTCPHDSLTAMTEIFLRGAFSHRAPTSRGMQSRGIS